MSQFTELLPRAWLVGLTEIKDSRGKFVKTLSRSLLENLGCEFDFGEEYYSLSKKDVIRGMHFQSPPHDHVKIIYCMSGAVLDVLLDLRPGPTYGNSHSIILEASIPNLLIVPRGIAHGFKSLVENSVLIYKTSSEYAPEYDSGILWNSFNFNWELIDPILSNRDKLHIPLADFKTPFLAL